MEEQRTAARNIYVPILEQAMESLHLKNHKLMMLLLPIHVSTNPVEILITTQMMLSVLKDAHFLINVSEVFHRPATGQYFVRVEITRC